MTGRQNKREDWTMNNVLCFMLGVWFGMVLFALLNANDD